MANVDPNVYALSIQLQLDSQAAFESLNSFGDSLTSLEEKISDVAEQALNKIDTISKVIDTSLSQAVGHLDAMDVGTSNIIRSIEKYNSYVNDANKVTESSIGSIDSIVQSLDANLAKSVSHLETMEASTLKLVKSIKNYNDFITEANDISKKDLKDLKIVQKLWQGLEKTHVNILKYLGDELKQDERILKSIESIDSAIKSKNKSHQEENRLVREEGNALKEAIDHQNRLNDAVDRGTKSLDDAVYAISKFFAFYKNIDKDTENFTTANYRLYGSQQELIQSTRNIAAAYGVTAESAIKAYKALADTAAPKEEIEKLAGTVASAARTTGVAEHTLVNYTRALKVSGLSNEQATISVVKLSEAMRRYGLTTNDINKLVNVSASEMANLSRMFGNNAEEIAKYQEFRAVFMGLGKSIGYSAEEASKLDKYLQDPVNWIAFGNAVGMNIQNQEDLVEANIRAGAAFANLKKEIDAMPPGNAQKQAALAYQQLAEATVGSVETADIQAKMYQKLEAELKSFGGEIDNAADKERALAAIQARELADANSTLTAQLTILESNFGVILKSVGQFIADGLVPLVMALNYVVGAIAYAVSGVMSFINEIGKTYPILGYMIQAVKTAVAVLFLLATIVPIVSGLMISFVGATNLVSTTITFFSTAMTTLATSMVTVASAIGRSIFIILSYLGRGLASLGRSVTTVLPQLLVLGVAMVLVATASYIFAMAVSIIAQVGWAAVPAIIGLVVAVGILGLVLYGLAVLIAPVSPIVIGIAFAMLLLGVAAMATGAGIMLAAMGLQIMSQFISVGFVGLVYMLSGAITALGIALLIASPGMILFSGAMLVAGVAAMMLGVAFNLISAAMITLKAISITGMASDLLIATTILIAAGGFAFVAGISLAAAAVVLVPAAILMSIAALGLNVAGLLLVIGSGLLFHSSLMLLASAVILPVAAVGILVAAGMIYLAAIVMTAGLTQMILASPLMLAAGVAMTLGSMALAVSSLLLLPVALRLVIAGLMIGMGGAAMLSGMIAITAAAGIMLTSGILLATASLAMLYSTSLLMLVAPEILLVGGLLLTGGLMMLTGVIAIGLSARILKISGYDFVAGSKLISEGMAYLYPAAIQMKSMGIALLEGTISLGIAMPSLLATAALLAPVGIALLSGSLILAAALVVIFYASVVLFSAGYLMYIGSNMLYIGTTILSMAVTTLTTVSASLVLVGLALSYGASFLLAASVIVLAAGSALYLGSLILNLAALIIVISSLMILSAGVNLAIGSSLLYQGSLILLAATQIILPTGNILILGAMNLLLASSLLIVSASVMTIAGSALYLSSLWLMTGAAALLIVSSSIFAAGTIMLNGARLLSAGVILLLSSTVNLMLIGNNLLITSNMLMLAAIGLNSSAMALSIASFSLILASLTLMTAGLSLIPATFMIRGALTALSLAVYGFAGTIDKIKVLGDAVRNIASAFSIISSISPGNFRAAIDEVLGSVPGLQKMTTELDRISSDLEIATRKFAKPANELANIMERLGSSLIQFGEGIALGEDVSKLATMLDQYATLMEGASERITTAVQQKAIPAMRSAEQAGIKDAVKSEAVTTVRVMNDEEGEKADLVTSNEIAAAQLAILQRMADQLDSMQPGGSGVIDEIASILKAYLPEMVNKDQGLSTEFNAWAK